MITKELFAPEYPLPALLFLPEKPDAQMPLLIYLHGAGERGESLEHLYRHGVPRMIKNGTELSAVVLAPQCPRDFMWENVVVSLKALIDRIAEEYAILPDRICITGSSMGGYGTWEMALTYPRFFSAIAPVAGGGLAPRCVRLKTTPIMAFHGTNDKVILPVCSQLMVDAAKEKGCDAQLVLLEGFGHNDGIRQAYENTQLLSWLLAQRRTDFSYRADLCEEYF